MPVGLSMVCKSSEACESLRIANPTCYPRFIVFGLMVMTEDANVTKTLALVLQTNAKQGPPCCISRPSFLLNGWPVVMTAREMAGVKPSVLDVKCPVALWKG